MKPLLKGLVRQLNETASVFAPVGWELETIVTEISGHTLRFAQDVGTRVPLHCTVSGKAVLAALRPDEFDRYLAQATLTRFTANTIVDERVLAVEARKICEEGYAFTQDEWTIGITAVGAVIISHGEIVAAISVACPTARFRASGKDDRARQSDREGLEQ